MTGDNHVTLIHPDDEDRQFAYTRETDDREQAEIQRRVQWAREQRERRGHDGGSPA